MNKNLERLPPIEISGNLLPFQQEITGNIAEGIGTEKYYDPYEGQYSITPLAFQDIILPVKDKRMLEDIRIKQIPYYETSNLSGGNTVYIAGHVEFS